MGSGEVASEAVVRTLKEQFENDAETFQLEEAIRTANTELLALQDECGKKALNSSADAER
ncbi:MAG: hypothetical protein IJL26_13560 [Clostridia bacterium]|nr:hypothetical protein [Clostridia bacterium]